MIIAPCWANSPTLDLLGRRPDGRHRLPGSRAEGAILDKFALDEAAWEEHLARRRARRRTAVPGARRRPHHGRRRPGGRRWRPVHAYFGRPLRQPRGWRRTSTKVSGRAVTRHRLTVQPAGRARPRTSCGSRSGRRPTARRRQTSASDRRLGGQRHQLQTSRASPSSTSRLRLGVAHRRPVGFRTHCSRSTSAARPPARRRGLLRRAARLYRRDRTNVFVNGAARPSTRRARPRRHRLRLPHPAQRWRAGNRSRARTRVSDRRPGLPDAAGPVSLARTSWASKAGQRHGADARLAPDGRDALLLQHAEKTGGFPQAEVTASTSSASASALRLRGRALRDDLQPGRRAGAAVHARRPVPARGLRPRRVSAVTITSRGSRLPAPDLRAAAAPRRESTRSAGSTPAAPSATSVTSNCAAMVNPASSSTRGSAPLAHRELRRRGARQDLFPFGRFFEAAGSDQDETDVLPGSPAGEDRLKPGVAA